MKHGRPGLRVADLETLLLVHRLGSITGAARELDVTPSQVSKAVARLESHFEVRLLSRSVRGVQLTDAGMHLVPYLDEALNKLRQAVRAEEAKPVITLVAPSYINTYLVPALARMTDIRLRALEMPPSLIRSCAGANLFDVTVILGEPRLPAVWHETRLGSCRLGLFTSPLVASRLGRQPVDPASISDLPFVSPVYNVGGQYLPVDDDCPIPRSTRRHGHEAQSFAIALDIASVADQLVYGPVFGATHHLSRGQVVEVRVRGWREKTELVFACNADKMLARVETVAVEILRRAHQALEVPVLTDAG